MRQIALGHRGLDPDRSEIVNLKDRIARFESGAVAHEQFADHAAGRRIKGNGDDGSLCGLEAGQHARINAQQAQPFFGGVGQLRESGAAGSQVVALECRKVRADQRVQEITLGDAVTFGARLQRRDATLHLRGDRAAGAFVGHDQAGRAQRLRQVPAHDRLGAHAHLLHGASIDVQDGFGIGRRGCRDVIGIFWLQIHIHEGRFAGLVEALVGHHRVVPVENLRRRARRCGSRRGIGHGLFVGLRRASRHGHEIHAADGTLARSVPMDLRMHGACVVGFGCFLRVRDRQQGPWNADA